jgi:uncharacterized protein YdeI (YjbR/CyaY-like superfamily)
LKEQQVEVRSRAQWRRWLQEHHQQTSGVWLVTWKKSSGGPHLANDQIVEEALAFGWIDSKPRALDSERTMLWLAPRKAGTGWSAPNKARIERAKKPETRAKRVELTASLAQDNERANQWRAKP